MCLYALVLFNLTLFYHLMNKRLLSYFPVGITRRRTFSVWGLVLECIVDLRLDPVATLWFVSLYQRVVSIKFDYNITSCNSFEGIMKWVIFLTSKHWDPWESQGSGKAQQHHKRLLPFLRSISWASVRRASTIRRRICRCHRSRGRFVSCHHV